MANQSEINQRVSEESEIVQRLSEELFKNYISFLEKNNKSEFFPFKSG